MAKQEMRLVEMDDETLRQHVRNSYLDKVIALLESNGRHWMIETRKVMGVLTNLIIEEGCKCILHEVPPEWEFVIDSVETDWDKINDIAEERAKLREQGINEDKLPV